MTFLAATNNLVFAFQNMVVGLGTVFLVLAFLILVISLFKYVNEWGDVQEALRQVRAAKNGEPAPAAKISSLTRASTCSSSSCESAEKCVKSKRQTLSET